jgi:hypothetical protein
VDDAERARIDHHLAGCLGCQAAVDQFRAVKRVTGRLRRLMSRARTH